MKKFRIEDTNIDLLLPKIDYFIKLIKDDTPFHFLKINHGFLDLFYHTYNKKVNNLIDLKTKIDELKFDSIATELLDTLKCDSYPTGENIKYYNGTSINVYNGLINLTKTYTQKNTNKIKIGVSTGVGLDYTFGEYPKAHPIQISRKKIIQILLNKSTDYYHSGILKHYSIMNELPNLFTILNELNFDVVFIGMDYFNKFKDIYSIKNFHHIKIPNRFAIEELDSIVKSIKTIHKNKTIIFHSTGHILSCEIAKLLEDTNVFGFDVGRSFDWDVSDSIEDKRKNGKYDWINARWMKDHKKLYTNYIKSIR